jgi:uncharacterized membrane-anchored protein
MVGTLEKNKTEIGLVILAIGLILLIMIAGGIVGTTVPLVVSTIFLIIIGAGVLWYDYKTSKSSK